jgi:hypothetical protein
VEVSLRALTVCALALSAGCSEGRRQIIVSKGRLEVESASVDFGDVPLGGKKTGVVRLKNTGGDVVNICLPRLADEVCSLPSRLDPVDQRFDWPLRDMRWLLRPSETFDFTVAFEPDRPGAFQSILVLGHDGDNGPQLSVGLTGNGVTPNVSFSAAAFDFGQVSLSRTATRTLMVQNLTVPETAVTLAFTSLVDEPAFELRAGGIDLLAQGTLSLAPGPAVPIEIRFSPVDERAFQRQVGVTYCPGCAQTLSMTGVGVAPGIEVEPQELTFPTHEDRAPSTASFEIRSTGSGPLTVLGFEVRDGPSEEFDPIDGTLPLVLQPGASATVDVEHLGRVPGIDVATLVVLSDAWMQPEVTLSLLAESTGPNIETVPTSLDFGAVRPNATAQRALVVQNSGNRPLTVSGIQISPAGDLNVAPQQLPAVLAPSERMIVPVTFSPLAAGTYQAMLLIASDDADQPSLLVPVSGVGGDPVGCSLSAAPSALDLGQRELGVTSRHRVELRNVGPESCTITDPVLMGDAGFSLVAGIPPQITVDPGLSAAIPIEFGASRYGTFQAVLEIATDDPTQPIATVPIAAVSQASSVRIEPFSIDFGPVNPSCRSKERSVYVHTYQAGARLDAVTLDPSSSSEFELGALTLPANLAANSSFRVPLHYRPSAAGEDFGILQITVDGVRSTLPLYGLGTTDTDIEDRATQAFEPKSDVLFVVNNTNSTSAERQRLSAAIPAFFTYGQAQGIDFRVAMVSMEIGLGGDRGRFLAEAPQSERVITPQSVDPEGSFDSNVSAGGNGNTGGIEASFLAVADPALNVDNTGFLRPDGLLSVIYISDEDDQSTGDLAAYERHLSSLKAARGGRFHASAIVGTVAGTCNSTFGSADYGPTYLAMVERTGGLPVTFCQDWGASVAAIAPYAFGRTRRFDVTGAPVSTSIEVLVDNNQIQRTNAQGVLQWTYSDQSGAVIFSEVAAPDFGAQVRIRYALECL